VTLGERMGRRPFDHVAVDGLSSHPILHDAHLASRRPIM
jgi:hypothetical protein